MQTTRHHNGSINVLIRSIGVRHPGALDAIGDGLYLDLSERLHDPHTDPAMRQMTGLDAEVRAHVLSTPGAEEIVRRTALQVRALLTVAAPELRLVRLTVACRGGRHRSVAIAEQIAEYLYMDGAGVEVEHLHIDQPVLPPKVAA
ncbi:RapZ C-terminal domain-containing protein [Streptomyces sp. NPDC003860]